MKVCSRPGCPELTEHASGKCEECQRRTRKAESARRGSPRKRGYGDGYERNRQRVVRDEDVCWICGHVVDKDLPGTDPNGPTADHVVPVEQGGTSDLTNLRLAHLRCNAARRDRG